MWTVLAIAVSVGIVCGGIGFLIGMTSRHDPTPPEILALEDRKRWMGVQVYRVGYAMQAGDECLRDAADRLRFLLHHHKMGRPPDPDHWMELAKLIDRSHRPYRDLGGEWLREMGEHIPDDPARNMIMAPVVASAFRPFPPYPHVDDDVENGVSS